MSEESFKPEKIDEDLIAEKDELWKIIDMCSYCQQGNPRDGRCSVHSSDLGRILQIERILEERSMVEEQRPATEEETKQFFEELRAQLNGIDEENHSSK